MEKVDLSLLSLSLSLCRVLSGIEKDRLVLLTRLGPGSSFDTSLLGLREA